MRAKHAYIAGFTTLLVLALAGSYYAYFYRGSSRGSIQAITIAQAGDFFLYAPLYVAVDAGLFEKQGLRVTLTSTGGDDKTWAAVLGGSASFGIADPTFVAISAARGQAGRVIASVVNGVPFWGVTFSPAIQPFTSPKHLAAHTVATFPAPSTAYALQERMFLDAGLKPKIRQGAFGTLIAMLRAGQADIALELEPNVSQVVTEGARVLYSMSKVYGDFAITGMTASPEFLRTRPDVAAKAVCGLQLALDMIRRDSVRTLDILAKRFPEVKAPVAAAALGRVVAEGIVPKSVAIDRAAWDKAIELRRSVGDLPSPKGMEAYVDNTFADQASRGCGR